MRPIKYRAWDKLNHRWLDLFQLAFAKDGSVMAVNTLDGETYGLHQVDLVEYTGLKDKQGKEIWEGDIVRLARDDKPEIRAKIVYDKGSFMYRYIINPWQHNEEIACFSHPPELNYEVIGNIYENKELLNDKD